MPRTAHLIFNPVAGQGNPQAELAEVRSHLEPAFDLTVYETSPDCDANALAAQAVEQGVDLVIASGGDGTINAAAETLMETSIPLAIIPRGTANAVASALGIPSNLGEACQVAIEGEPYVIDTARCNGRPMVLLAGVGFEADVVERASRAAKNRFGMMAYILAGFQQLKDLPSFEAVLETDDKVVAVQACAITVANMAPPTSILAQGPAEVVVDDGLLDITIVATEGIGSALAASYELLRSALSGEATQRDDIGFLRSKSIKITTDPPQKVVLDGEMLGEIPIEIVCVPKGLTLIVPQQPSIAKDEDIEGLPGVKVEIKGQHRLEDVPGVEFTERKEE
ncbi:MAG: YegS/Rv2252/BmrU family lipid kinase [Cyanobacteria bacterium P01_A01_bin.114]